MHSANPSHNGLLSPEWPFQFHRRDKLNLAIASASTLGVGHWRAHAHPIPKSAVGVFEPLLTADEAAKHLRIHVKTLHKLAREQRVPCVRMGKYWMFRLSALDLWVSAQQNHFSQPLRVN